MPTNLNNEEVFSKDITEIASVSSINPSDSFLVGQGSEIKKATANQVQDAKSIQGRTVTIPASGLRDNALLRYKLATNQFELVNEPELFVIADAQTGSIATNGYIDISLTEKVDRGNNFSGNRVIIPRTGWYEVFGRVVIFSANSSDNINNVSLDFYNGNINNQFGDGITINLGSFVNSSSGANAAFAFAATSYVNLPAGVSCGWRIFVAGPTGIPVNYRDMVCGIREVSVS